MMVYDYIWLMWSLLLFFSWFGSLHWALLLYAFEKYEIVCLLFFFLIFTPEEYHSPSFLNIFLAYFVNILCPFYVNIRYRFFNCLLQIFIFHSRSHNRTHVLIECFKMCFFFFCVCVFCLFCFLIVWHQWKGMW